MPPANYKVTQLETVVDEVRSLIARARAEGRIVVFRQALRYLMDELAYDPTHLGESRARLESLDQERRITHVRPLAAEFIIHEPTRTVTVVRVRLLD
ncbi:MAG: hypothetical protein U0804_19900 [Gemmataceae bacterium]